jgi:hypothetical protein
MTVEFQQSSTRPNGDTAMNEPAPSGVPSAGRDALENGLDDDESAQIKAELEPGERLLWAASSDPPPGQFGWGYILFLVIAAFFFLLGTTALADAFGRFGRRPPEQSTMVSALVFYAVAGVVVVAIIASRINEDINHRAAGEVLYAVTDRRAISWVPEVQARGVRVRSLPGTHIVDVMRVERSHGSGNLEFVCSAPSSRYNFHSNVFKDIVQVHRVEQIVRKNLISVEPMTRQRDHDFGAPS